MKVIKRDGRKKDFEFSRIAEAVGKAFDSIYDMSEDEKSLESYNKVIDRLSDIFDGLDDDRTVSMNIEEIQNTIILVLKDIDKKAATAYSDYRNKRTVEREFNGDIMKKVNSILNCSNVLNSNANVDENSFGGRKFESAGVLMKNYALNYLMDKDVAKAHLENRIYQHDLDCYALGMHNCSFPDLRTLINETGFVTRNGDVRESHSLTTAFQLVAVIFQVQSQEQFGGTGSCHLDYDLEDQVNISFRKHYADVMTEDDDNALRLNLEYDYHDLPEDINIENIEHLLNTNFLIAKKALRRLEREGSQAAQGMYHNLNTLESRPGSQVPFTSINIGRRTTVAGRLINRWVLDASIDGIGKFHRTSIFPISIFQYKKGVNDKQGTTNYDLKMKAIESMSKRIYPNWVNCDWSGNIDDPDDPDTWMATMGCRTLIGYDRNGMGYKKVGRGNVVPVTINLVKLGILHGICLGDRAVADLEGFDKEFDATLDLAVKSLVSRYKYIISQNQASAPFMYKNKTMLGGDYDSETCVEDVMKHGTLAIGYIGIAEMCQALFGMDHADGNKEVHEFALSVVKKIYDKAKEASEEYGLNFGCYASPAESTCGTIITGNRELQGLRQEFGIIPNVTDRDWATNSHHVPVWKNVDIFEKLRIEAPFTKYATSGCITYVELDSSIMNNPKAIEQIIDYAFSLDIPYLAFNFPIDTCLDCGFSGEFNDRCTVCGSFNIEQLRRVTGYLSTDYRKFNKAKQAEVRSRFKHSTITRLNYKERIDVIAK
jgi:anaerobic ribonucleoside-triphosphate reductase